jgi:hypothetical protein
VSVITNQAGGVDCHPDVPLAILKCHLNNCGGERVDFPFLGVMRERKLLAEKSRGGKNKKEELVTPGRKEWGVVLLVRR